MEERPDYVVYRAKRIWHLAYKLALVSWTTFVDHSQANRHLEHDHFEGFDSDKMSPLYENRSPLLAYFKCDCSNHRLNVDGRSVVGGPKWAR